MFSFEQKGSFSKTDNFLQKMLRGDIYKNLDKYGRMGAAALAQATPRDTGRTASSWTYDISKTRDTYTITWRNTNVQGGRPVAIMLQYGHGTGTGGYVQGRDYINPVVRPLFDQIANEVWKVVTST